MVSNTVDVWNPKQPPWMRKKPWYINGISTTVPSTGEFTGFQPSTVGKSSNPKAPDPSLETRNPPNDTPRALKQVVLTPHDIPWSLREGFIFRILVEVLVAARWTQKAQSMSPRCPAEPLRLYKSGVQRFRAPQKVSQMLNVYGVFTYIYPQKSTLHVGKYTSPMDPMGVKGEFIHRSFTHMLNIWKNRRVGDPEKPLAATNRNKKSSEKMAHKRSVVILVGWVTKGIVLPSYI